MSLKKASRTKSLSLSEDFPMRVPKPKNPLAATNTSSPINAPSASTAAVGLTTTSNKRAEDATKILKYIDDNIIGKGVAFLGPFGRRKVVYADYSSSGRSLQFIEDYINKEVLPAFGDITCTSAVTGLQSHLYANEAKEIVRASVNASEDDEIFLCDGTNTTPVERLCYMLCYEHYQSKSNDSKFTDCPVLFVSTNEPSKNLTPWINAGVQIIKISKTRDGFLDLVDLEKKLSTFSETNRPLIGLFSGASRMTGLLADDVATTILLHQYNALSVWDYSAAAPFSVTDMNPILPGSAKDALFFNVNHFIGGVQGPGVLLVKKSFISTCCDRKEISGNIEVISSVRAGLAVQLKESLGLQTIATRQEKLCKQILAHIRTIPEIVLLGPLQMTAKRIPTMCFLVKHPRGAYLHQRFVVAVLNDVFGIQATAGGHIGDALGISRKLGIDYEHLLSDEQFLYEHLRPGYTRISIPFFMPDSELAFILEALKMTATEAWKLLPQYEIEEKTGEWKHNSNSLIKERKWLGSIRYTDGRMLFSDRRISGPGAFPTNYADCLQTARNLFNRSRKMAQKTLTPYLDLKLKNHSAEHLRWYMLPGEAHELLLGHSQNVRHSVQFNPNRIPEPPSLLNMFRHNSLSALDVKRFKSRSLPTSPIQLPMRRQFTSPTPPNSPKKEILKTSSLVESNSPPIVRFSLGGEVTTLASFTPPRASNLTNNSEDCTSSRNRCRSWSSSAVLREGSFKAHNKKSFNSQTQISLGVVEKNEKMLENRLVNFYQLEPLRIQQPTTEQEKQKNVLSKISEQISHRRGVTNMDESSYKDQRLHLCSCSSQTDLLSPADCIDNVFAPPSPVPSPQNINIFLQPLPQIQRHLAGSTCSDCTEEIQAYVAEVTKELATEIKSEIREVISQVEDVLESSENTMDISSINMTSLTNFSTTEDRSDSVSATDVAEYLKEFSREMTSDIKTEIREAVTNAMNEVLSHEHECSLSKNNSVCDIEGVKNNINNNNASKDDRTDLINKSTTVPLSALKLSQPILSLTKKESETFSRPNSTSGWHHHPTASSPDTSTPTLPYTGAISKLADPISTSSRDSGINMCFHDPDETRSRTVSEGLNERIIRGPPASTRLSHSDPGGTQSSSTVSNIKLLSSPTTVPTTNNNNAHSERTLSSSATTSSSSVLSSHKNCDCKIDNTKNILAEDKVLSSQMKLQHQAFVRRLPTTESSSESCDKEPNKWHHLPKEVWKHTAEAIDEFDMLRDGDRILVCLSGSSASLCLLHALRQFSRARGIHIEMAALTVGNSGVDPRALMLYLRDISIHLIIEQLGPFESLKNKIYFTARRNNFNVIAMGNTLDKLADEFIFSVLHKGKLYASQAHCRSREGDLRIVRPFMYVRERSLEDFVVQKNIPSRPSSMLTKPLDGSNSVLKVQEIINPNVYENIKMALRPLLAVRLESSKSSYELFKLSLLSRE